MKSDEPAEAEWVRTVIARYAAPLTRYAALITGDLERARDVVQDTFVRLCAKKQSQVEPILAQWLFTVCRNRALDVQRKESRMRPLSDVEMDLQTSAELSPAAEMERRETATDLLGVVGTLPKNQQEVI